MQSPSQATSLVVRSDRDPQQLAAAIRNVLREMDAGLPFQVNTWPDVLSIALFPSRVATVALGALGAMGAMLAITGIFGLAAYLVSKRLREIGIRVALGAQRTQVLRAALGRPVKLLAIGSVAGLLLGILATRVLAYIVYQANPRDPLVLGGVVAAMAALGAIYRAILGSTGNRRRLFRPGSCAFGAGQYRRSEECSGPDTQGHRGTCRYRRQATIDLAEQATNAGPIGPLSEAVTRDPADHQARGRPCHSAICRRASGGGDRRSDREHQARPDLERWRSAPSWCGISRRWGRSIR